MGKETCSQCKFFVSGERPNMAGMCVRFPPTLVQTRGYGYGLESKFPTLSVVSWCGEWKAPTPMYDPEIPIPPPPRGISRRRGD